MKQIHNVIWLSFQMVPLMMNSCETLVEKLGEYAESGKSVDVFGYVCTLSFFRSTTITLCS